MCRGGNRAMRRLAALALALVAVAGCRTVREEVQPLRGGPVAALVRIATRPVTRLLELHLTGTFDRPRWRLVNPAGRFTEK